MMRRETIETCAFCGKKGKVQWGAGRGAWSSKWLRLNGEIIDCDDCGTWCCFGCIKSACTDALCPRCLEAVGAVA